MISRDNKRNQVTEQEVKIRLRSMAPTPPDASELCEQYLAHRRALSRRTSRWSNRQRVGLYSAVAIILLCVLVGNNDDLGSGGFDLEPTGSVFEGSDGFETVIGEVRYGTSPNDTRPISDKQEVVENVYERDMAGQRKLVEVTGWTIHGEDIFFPAYSYLVNGKEEVFGQNPMGGSKSSLKDFFSFAKTDINGFLTNLEKGLLDQEPDATRAIDGQDIEFQRWSAQYENWEKIIYWIGQIE